MAWISFSFLDLTSSVTGGLIEDLGAALGSLGGLLGPTFGTIIGIIGGAFIGLALIFLFPIHWCLFYRPDDVLLIISIILPWILCCTITSALFAHSPRGGIHTSLAIGIGYMIPALLIYFLIPVIVNAFSGGMIPGLGSMIAGILDGLASGLTDLPYALAVFTSILEGSLVGAVFGGFIGSLKYKPEGAVAKAKKVKKGEVLMEPTLEDTESKTISKTDFCTNCGAKLVAGDEFCTNCGAKVV
jgi:hypothetical protein